MTNRDREPSPALTLQEARLVASLRQLDPGPLRDHVVGLIDEVLEFGVRPGCTEAAVDGFPCVRLVAACDRCREVRAAVDAWRQPRRGARPVTP